jgi:hypothetical protein
MLQIRGTELDNSIESLQRVCVRALVCVCARVRASSSTSSVCACACATEGCGDTHLCDKASQHSPIFKLYVI